MAAYAHSTNATGQFGTPSCSGYRNLFQNHTTRLNLTLKRNMLPPMATDTQSERLLALAAQQGLLRACHLQALGIAQVVLKRLTACGALKRVGPVGRGV